MVRCEICKGLNLFDKCFIPTNPQTGLQKAVDYNDGRWCQECELYVVGEDIESYRRYLYFIPRISTNCDGDIVSNGQCDRITVEMNESGTSFIADSFDECSEDGHFLVFTRNITSDIYQTVHIDCFPKLGLSGAEKYIDKFLDNKPKMTAKIYKSVPKIEQDRLVGIYDVELKL